MKYKGLNVRKNIFIISIKQIFDNEKFSSSTNRSLNCYYRADLGN